MAASAPTNAPNLNAASHAALWSRQRDAKRLNPCSPILATWLSVSCACAAPASASAATAVRRRRFAVIRLPALRRPATASAAVSAGSRKSPLGPLVPIRPRLSRPLLMLVERAHLHGHAA